jgi:hypothetical protein
MTLISLFTLLSLMAFYGYPFWDLDQLIHNIVLDGVLGLARLVDLDQLIHTIVLDGVLGLACLDDLDQLIHNFYP